MNNHIPPVNTKLDGVATAIWLGSLVLGSLFFSSYALANALQTAQDKYVSNKVSEAVIAFETIASDLRAGNEERAEAARFRAKIAWLIYQDTATANRWLDRAAAAKHRMCATTASRIRFNVNNVNAAVLVHDLPSQADCNNDKDFLNLVLEFSRAQLRAAMLGCGASCAKRAANAIETRAPLQALDPDVLQLKLSLALFANDGKAAVAAWIDYTKQNSADAMVFGVSEADAKKILLNGLARSTLDDQVSLLKLLVRTGLHEDASWLHKQSPKAVQRRSQFVPIYAELRQTLLRRTTDFNRQIARNLEPDQKRYEKRLRAALSKAAAQLRPSGEDADNVLEQELGIFTATGNTGGVWSLHSGHKYIDASKEVEQLGKRAVVRFVMLDNMLGNGFQTWLWDGTAQTGGWAFDKTIVQVRKPYARSAIRAASRIQSEAGRKADDERLRELLEVDQARAESDPPVYLPGVALKLELSTIDAIHADIEAGIDNKRAEFVALYMAQDQERSIFIHEGRHIIDYAVFGQNAIEGDLLEYRAKLAELRFGRYPRSAFSTINAPNIGDQSAHGKANARLISALRIWMSKRASSLPGIDSLQPMLMQIDKLSDNALREFAIEHDPGFESADRLGAPKASSGDKSN
jgi:hypothetical protein